jgi:spermidine/putrescine-binding protein
MRLYWKFITWITIIVSGLLFIAPVFAEDNSPVPTVNILTWWGYLRSPAIHKLVQDTCHVNFSYDEYYSEEEFLRRFTNNKEYYDIIIFSHPIYPVIKSDIALPHNELWKQSLEYYPVIRQHYLSDKLSSNIAYFLISFSGILWNPQKINITENDTLQSMLAKAGNNIVILPDDFLDMAIFLNGKQQMTVVDFVNLVKSNNVYIVNNFQNITANPNFAFALTWSGEALALAKWANLQNFKFSLNSNLSYISPDLLAVLNGGSNANCVAKVLTGKKAGTIFENEIYYFSPYEDINNIMDKEFRELHMVFFKKLQMLPWMKPVSIDEFKKLKLTWDLMKVKLTEK